jgi:hypothetical protein
MKRLQDEQAAAARREEKAGSAFGPDAVPDNFELPAEFKDFLPPS